MKDWFVQQLRFSAFIQGAQPELAGIWSAGFGEPAEIEENRPREGVRRLSGPSMDTGFDLIGAPNRVDLMQSGLGQSPSVHFGEAMPRIESFQAVVISMLPVIDVDVMRIAFGALLVREVPSLHAAYAMLQGLLPVRVDASRSRDFIYQINHPQASKSDQSLELNRLSKWSAMKAITMRMVGTNVSQPTETHFVVLEVDNSTAAVRTSPLNRDLLPTLFTELVSLCEVSCRGDLE